MKKYIIGFVLGAILFLPVGAKAWPDDIAPQPKPIYQFNDCGSACRNEVAVFDDQDNKCYISYDKYGAQSSISCVKQGEE